MLRRECAMSKVEIFISNLMLGSSDSPGLSLPSSIKPQGVYFRCAALGCVRARAVRDRGPVEIFLALSLPRGNHCVCVCLLLLG